MKVAVFGAGYVGLVQAAVLAEIGHSIICVDVDQQKVNALNSGKIHIYEPGLENLIRDNIADKRLTFTTNSKQAVEFADIIFIAVGTPPDEDGSADLFYVLKVTESIALAMNGHKTLVIKSTVPVGTGDKVKQAIKDYQQQSNFSFDIVSNPEFLKEGSAVSDCMRPDRIIIGVEDEYGKAVKQMRTLYAPFNRNHEKILVMDVRSAELTKYAANSMLATKISFMNEMANVAEKLGADIEKVRHGIGSDPRIGYHFIYPGCGYGGSCFPKDVTALIKTAEQQGYSSNILKAVEQVNSEQKDTLFHKLMKHFNGSLENKTIAIWGLSFKPKTDDMREAPSRNLMESLWQVGANVQAFDPEAMSECLRIYPNQPQLQLVPEKYLATQGADALVICTEWQQFKAPDFKLVHQLLLNPVIIDGRNLFEPEEMAENGFIYYGIGRGKSLLLSTDQPSAQQPALQLTTTTALIH